MYKLNIKNFQRIKEANLELQGFCVIEGPSNLGKSSVCRALGVITQNQWESGFVSKEAKNTSITLETDDFKVNCLKGNVNEFHIEMDGKTFNYAKAGKEVPKELVSRGFSPLLLGKEKVSLLIAEQYDPLFMVIYSDVMNTRILNNVFDVDVIEKANEFVIKDIMNQKRELKRELSYNEEKTADLEITQASLEVMLKLRDYYDKIDLIDSYKGCKSDITVHEERRILNQKSLDTFELLENKLTMYSKLTEIQNKRLSLESMVKELQGLSDRLKMINIYKEYSKIDKYLQVKVSIISNSELLESVNSKISSLSKVQSILNKFKIIRSYRVIKNKLLDTDKRIVSLSRFKDLSLIEDKLKKLSNFLVKKQAFNSISITYLNNESIIEDYHNEIKQLGVCPCCSQTLK